MRVGILVNPDAGLGGKLGLKGSDGKATEAREAGAEDRAGPRMKNCLSYLPESVTAKLKFIAAPGRMGGDWIPFEFASSGENIESSTAQDTMNWVQQHTDLDLLVYAGGDGTTRDIVEASLEIGGHHIRLIDTAGYRNTNDQIEKLGINRTKNEVGKADIIICLGENKEDLLSFSKLMANKNIITVLSKCDINKCAGYELSVSSKDGLGVEELLTQLSTKIVKVTSSKSINSEYFINDRQQEVLTRLFNKVESLKERLLNEKISLDIISEYVKEIVDGVDEIVNPIGRDEIINNIFSSFCVGK